MISRITLSESDVEGRNLSIDIEWFEADGTEIKSPASHADSVVYQATVAVIAGLAADSTAVDGYGHAGNKTVFIEEP